MLLPELPRTLFVAGLLALLPGWVHLTAAQAANALRVTVDAAGQFLILEGDQPVLRYNAQPVPVPAGVSGPYAVARSNYIHPLFGLAGEVLTEDYAKDHPHHRGLYWAWPEVTWKGTTHDLHALQGLGARLEGSVRQQAEPRSLLLEADNVWLWEGREALVRETVGIRVFPAAGGRRGIDISLRFEALQPGVTIARRQQDAYGGLNLRFSARAGQQLTQHTGPARFPAAESWGELAGVPPGGQGPVGVVILPHPDNPDYPPQWITYPELNWLQPAFPAAGTAFALEPGQPLTLRYRLVVRQGEGLQAEPAALWRDFLAGWQPLASLADYRFGQDTASLRAWERRLSASPAADHPAIARALVAVLEAATASPDLKGWACDQLKRYGDAGAVPALVAQLGDPSLAAAAAAALETLPDGAVDAALRQVLPDLPAARQPQVIALLGARRDPAAVSMLADCTRAPVPAQHDAAVTALGVIGTPAAATALTQCLRTQPADARAAAAALACADRLLAGPAETHADGLALLRVTLETAPTETQRQAARARLARAAPAAALAAALQAAALQALAAGTASDRRGAALVLQALPAAAVTEALAQQLPQLADEAALVAIEVLATRPDPTLVPALLPRLGDAPVGAAAARLLGVIGEARCVPALAGLAVSRGEAGAAARQALRSLPGPDVDAAIRALAQSPEPALRRLAADLLAERLREASLADMLELAQDPDLAVSRRAFDVLGERADSTLVPRLLALLPALPETQRPEALGALTQIARRSGDLTPTVDGLLRLAPPGSSLRTDVLACLHGLPCDAAALALREALAAADPVPAEAAGRTLLKWPTTPTPELLEAVRQALPKAPEGTLRAVLEKALQHLLLAATRNLCAGRPVTASHPCQEPWRPELAVDGVIDTTSYWSCAESPSSLTVDLGDLLPVAAVRVINYWDGSRFYQYTVEGSADGTAWAPLADLSQNTTPASAEGTLHRFPARPARYLRVTMLKNSVNPGMHIVEVQAFSQLPASE
jgi:HEAT repeat protein